MARARVYVDEMIDAAYLSMSGGAVARTLDVAEGVHLDLAADGRVLGVELLDPPAEVVSALRAAAR